MPGDPQVQKLQETLLALGFALVGQPDGKEGAKTRLALREFQALAGTERTARVIKDAPAGRWVERLEQVVSTLPNPPTVTGEMNAETQVALDHWVARDYRCPLVIEARATVGADFQPLLENLWDYGDAALMIVRTAIRTKTGRDPTFEFRVADFTGPEVPHTKWELMPLLGTRGFLAAWGGRPRRFRSPELFSECLPDSATGKSWSALDANNKLVFRVVRAVCEQECIGFFDAFNSYDTAIMSLGPCHWTVTLRKRGKDGSTTGELAPFLAFAIGRDPTIMTERFELFGIAPEQPWPPGTAGQPYKGSWDDTRNFGGRLSWQTGKGRQPMTSYSDLSWFRTPQWYWRFLRMTAGHPSLLQSEWTMARVRLRDVLTAKVGGKGPYKDKRIGEIFTSPLACALILRFHIKAAGFVAPVNDYPTKLIERAGVKGDPATWGDADEKKLIDALVGHAIRKAYPLAKIPRADPKKPPTVKELLDYGASLKPDKRKDLHKDVMAVRAWPDAAVFSERGYALEQAARVALSETRGGFSEAFNALMGDPTLPPQPN